MMTSLADDELVGFDNVDDSVFVIDATRPRASERMAQLLRLADAGEWITKRFGGEAIEPFQRRFIGRLPMQVVLPRLGGEGKSHESRSACSMTSPRRAAASAPNNRVAFTGERSK